MGGKKILKIICLFFPGTYNIPTPCHPESPSSGCSPTPLHTQISVQIIFLSTIYTASSPHHTPTLPPAKLLFWPHPHQCRAPDHVPMSPLNIQTTRCPSHARPQPSSHTDNHITTPPHPQTDHIPILSVQNHISTLF